MDCHITSQTPILQGKLRSIGVSNFGVVHLEKLAQTAQVTPAVNQIELHPFLQWPRLVQYCQSKDIIVEVWGLGNVEGLKWRQQGVLLPVHGRVCTLPALPFSTAHRLPGSFFCHIGGQTCQHPASCWDFGAYTSVHPTRTRNSSSIPLIQAYSPLAKGQKLDDPTVKQLAQKLNVTPAQLLIR